MNVILPATCELTVVEPTDVFFFADGATDTHGILVPHNRSVEGHSSKQTDQITNQSNICTLYLPLRNAPRDTASPEEGFQRLLIQLPNIRPKTDNDSVIAPRINALPHVDIHPSLGLEVENCGTNPPKQPAVDMPLHKLVKVGLSLEATETTIMYPFTLLDPCAYLYVYAICLIYSP